MCGIAGIVSQQVDVNSDLFDALTMLQHRGQDAAGMITNEGHRLYLRKENGLVRDVFHSEEHMAKLRGHMGVAHVRYPTAGTSTSAEAQPFYTNTPFGISLSHNGNLTNAEELKQELFLEDRRHLNTESDSEVLLNVFAHELLQRGVLRLTPDDIFAAVSGVHLRCRGAYACVAMVTGFGVVGFRDPFGIRPIVYGKRESAKGVDYMIASESVALDALGYEMIADIAPGEAVLITLDGKLHKRQCAANPIYSPCIFEHVYLARPDSVMDNIYVYKARLRMGVKLAEKILREWPDHDIDVVIPIPDTSRVAGAELAARLGVHYREGFIKNRYIGRTFLMPGQAIRKKSVRQKLNAIGSEFKGKTVLLVDDSVVRGTTSREIVQMARDSGAKRVIFASAAPPVKYPNVYGIDMPTRNELIAYGRTNEEVCREITADALVYQDIDALKQSISDVNPILKNFEASCFDGVYVTGDISRDYLDRIEFSRNNPKPENEDAVRSQLNLNLAQID